MHIFMDNQILKILIQDAAKIANDPLISNLDNQIRFRWPTFFEYLGLESLLKDIPAFDHTHPLFQASIATLYTNDEKEVLFYVYDQLFVENLNQIKSLTSINASFLLQAIKEKRKETSPEVSQMLGPSLEIYESALLDNPSDTMHDLILYLAWDRLCVSMAYLFNHQSSDATFLKGVNILKECLIESYEHITQQGRTFPGIYRMLEALFFYQMREENLHNHTAAQWTVLSQSFPALKAEDKLLDLFYIDDAIIQKEKLNLKEEQVECYLTLDSPELVNIRLAFAQYMLDQLKKEFPHWSYVLCPKSVIHFSL